MPLLPRHRAAPSKPLPCAPCCAAVSISVGESKGQTTLPLPAGDAAPQDTASAAGDNAKIRILEAAVVTWTKQIKGVLKADPDAPLKVRRMHDFKS
jgi:hypothetical protein